MTFDEFLKEEMTSDDEVRNKKERMLKTFTEGLDSIYSTVTRVC